MINKIGIQMYAIVALLLGTAGLYYKIGVLEDSIKTIAAEKNTLVVKLELTKLQVSGLEATIDVANEAIDKMAIDANEAQEVYAKWKAKPAEVKWKEVYTYIPSDVDMIGKDQCAKLMEVEAAIKRINYEDL